MQQPTDINKVVLNILQKHDKNLSSFEESFSKLQIEEDDAKLLEKKLNRLNLDEDDKSKLIARAPAWPKETYTHKITPYNAAVRENVNVNQYVSYGHACKGVYVVKKNFEQTNNNRNHLEQTTHRNIACTCDTCILKMAYMPEFANFIAEKLQEEKKTPNKKTSESNNSETLLKQSTNKTDVIRPQLRRYSEDSGFNSDNPSPFSDSVLSPMSNNTQPSTTEQKQPRKILPKSTMDDENSTKINQNKIKSAKKQSAKELLRSKLNPDVKQAKWVKVLMKRDDEIFGKDNEGQTILQRLLQSHEKYIPESFYAIVERLRKNPKKCEHIIDAKTSIRDAICDNNHSDLLVDYFSEFLTDVEDNIQRKKSQK